MQSMQEGMLAKWNRAVKKANRTDALMQEISGWPESEQQAFFAQIEEVLATRRLQMVPDDCGHLVSQGMKCDCHKDQGAQS